MNKKNNSIVLAAAVLLLGGSHLAQAQETAADGVLKLPETVRSVASIDAHNILLVESGEPETTTESEYSALIIRHVYSGGIARLFGGTVIPTEMLVSPAFNKGGGFGGGMTGGIRSFGGGNANATGFSGGLNGGNMSQILNRLDRAPQQTRIGQ